MTMATIISWNVNGLRAIERKGVFKELLAYDADIMCLQETKCEKDQLEEQVRNPEGYRSYFSHAKSRKGYSGVALYTKEEPRKVSFGIDVPGKDDEGRTIVSHFEDFVLVNCYFPNGGGSSERL